MSRSLVGFVAQSVCAGFGLMCRAYTDRLYMTAWNTTKASDHQKTVPLTMTPEKKAIYEKFHLLETHVNKSQPPFAIGYATSMKKSLTIDPKRKKLKGQMSDGPSTSADGIFISLDELYAKAINKEVAVAAKEELECDGEEVEQARMELESTAKKSKISKKKKDIYPKIGGDVSSLGLATLREKNILESRAELTRRSKEKNLRQCIVNYLGKEQGKAVSISLLSTSEYRGF